MGKKKQEMSQVYNSNNEFIFGEKGGKGKNLSTFLKNLSLTTSPSQPQSEFNEANSNIYGSLSYSNPNTNEISRSNPSLARRASPKRSLSGPTNMSFAHSLTPTASEALRTNSPTRTKRVVSAKYADLDDDWDANFDDARVDTDMPSVRREGFGNTFLDPSPMLDSLYPDLTIPAGTKEPVKDSIDLEDMKIKLEINKLNQLNTKFLKFKALLTQSSNINLQELRKLSWNGIPSNLRAISWQILLGYLPTNKSRQSATLKIKRQEYLDGIKLMQNSVNFDNDDSKSMSSSSLNLNRDKQIYHQIKIDVKRTNPTVKLYGHPEVQKSLRKILYFWAIRHPASGYVQGINDLVTPFFQIFLTNYIWQLQRTRTHETSHNPEDDDSMLFIPDVLDPHDPKEQALLNDPQLFNYNLHNLDPTQISSRVLSIIEADTYWCLSRLLETITDNYIHQQPGILKQVSDLKNLISKIDIDLIHHFEQENIEFLQFAFRWMNCLLMRELSIDLIIRMWDTYLSESPLGFSNFHIYVCAAFLIKFSSDLKQKDFQEIILFLQNPPTSHWTDKDIELMLSEAFIWSSLYKNASAHLR
ncbi:GTPase-activating protein [Yamadazyma tenuis]|uniref:GTPase-activating protein n=1 Tax=Candida tenuis TaxID=2315449 RepID=UPI00279E98A5|nr:GTPase-activating protein [Yamadazyma tenuis]